MPSPHRLRRQFQTARQRAIGRSKSDGLTIHDLRGTAVTRLAEAICEAPEIAAITRHSLRWVGASLDRHPSNRGDRTATNASHKLQMHGKETKSPD